MQLELFNRSKYRDGSAPGDDIPVAIPGVVLGVFDGATDPLGTVVDGTAAGRLAAMTVATEMAAIALDPVQREAAGSDIINRLSQVLKNTTDRLGLQVPPSTTLAVALDCGATWRFMILGDSGIRLNGHEVHHREKVIDKVSTVARIAMFNDFRSQKGDLDRVEMQTRRGIFLGLETAIAEGVMSSARAADIVEQAVTANKLEAFRESVAMFLMGGIQTQFRFGNATGNPLCFDTLNGTTSPLIEFQDFERDKADIQSIEIYTDGYPTVPADISVAAWEAAFHVAQQNDFHMTGPLAAVKGATSTEHHDDRSVVIWT